jgi:dihydropteroate synthase
MKAKDSLFSKKYSFNFRGKILDLSTPKIMGVLNVTPDSFFDGGENNSLENAKRQGEKMINEGVSILDIGGYSSKPGAKEVSVEEEINRTVPVIEALRLEFPDVFLSVDTFRSKVGKANVEVGADMINDISAGNLDEEMIPWIKAKKIPYVAMHMRGNPSNMQEKTNYINLTNQVLSELLFSVRDLNADHPLILDPGFGFSKTIKQNYELMHNLDVFNQLDQPFLIGVSRKSMIYKLLNSNPKGALNGTSVLNTIGIMKGASILRVHDVKEAVEVVKLVKATLQS